MILVHYSFSNKYTISEAINWDITYLLQIYYQWSCKTVTEETTELFLLNYTRSLRSVVSGLAGLTQYIRAMGLYYSILISMYSVGMSDFANSDTDRYQYDIIGNVRVCCVRSYMIVLGLLRTLCVATIMFMHGE